MKEFIDKLIERLEEKAFIDYDEYYTDGGECLISISDVKEIANELAEEYINTSTISKMENVGWVPCKEEMPSKYGNYLVCDSQGNRYIARYYAGSTTFNRNVGFVAKAWCELPAPYTEGE